MGGKSDAPPAPDYAGAANATAEGNLANSRLTTKANRVNYNTPYGNLSYAQDPNDQDLWSANVQLSPDQQGLLDQQSRTSQGLANLQDSATARVGSSLGSAMPQAYDPRQATNNAAELINARLQPQQDRARAAQQTRLAAQGITEGSEAWRNANTDLAQQENDARQQAQLAGINLGMQQQGQQYQQAFANRNAPINELSAIRSGSQVSMPTFGSSAQQQYTGGADMLGAANSQYNAAVQGVNAENSASSGLFGGVLGLGGLGLKAAALPAGSLGFFSDRRLKSDIRYLGKLAGRHVYDYAMWGGRSVGVMAQEVPHIVHEGGYLMVDYAGI